MKSIAAIAIASAAAAGLLGSAAVASASRVPLQFDIAEVDLSPLQKRDPSSSSSSSSQPLEVSPHVLEMRRAAGSSRAQTWIQAIRNGPGASGMFETGHLANMTFLGSLEYIATIGFGDEQLEVIVDTGSSDTWAVQKGFICEDVNGETLNDTSVCGFGPTYNGTFQYGSVAGVHFNVSYGDGEYALGLMGYVNVTVAGLEVPHQEVALVNRSYWDGDAVTSGLIGLAFDLITSEYADGSDVLDSYSPIFTTMYKEGIVSPALFSMAMDAKTQTGQLAFGGLPPVETQGDFISTPIRKVAIVTGVPNSDTEYSFFTIFPDGYVVNKVPFPPTAIEALAASEWNTAVTKPAGSSNMSTPAIVDCGTTLTYVPADVSDAYANAFPESFFDHPSGLYFAPCDSSVPEFGVVINGHTFFANAIDLLLTNQPTQFEDNVACPIGVSNGGTGPYILGDTWMNSLVTVFDVGAGMMRFASRA